MPWPFIRLLGATVEEDESRLCAEKYWQGRTEVQRHKPITVPRVFHNMYQL